jgi:DNA-directed RNA polymerase specialized sigma24 family protein
VTLDQRKVEEQRLLAQLHISGMIGDRTKSSLLQMYYPWLQKRYAQILRHESDGKDAAQETALQVYSHLPRFEGRSS